MDNKNDFNVILVEDNTVLREELTFQLSANNIAITAVAEGVALKHQLQEKKYNLAILDIGLPGENGLSIAKRLRQTYPDMWIIILTAQDTLGSRLNGFENRNGTPLDEKGSAVGLLNAQRQDEVNYKELEVDFNLLFQAFATSFFDLTIA